MGVEHPLQFLCHLCGSLAVLENDARTEYRFGERADRKRNTEVLRRSGALHDASSHYDDGENCKLRSGRKQKDTLLYKRILSRRIGKRVLEVVKMLPVPIPDPH